MDAISQEANIVDLVDEQRPAKVKDGYSWTSSDPTKQFGFSANPFADNVNPDFFFRTEGHEEAFILMKRAVEDFASLGLCTALSGTGKTLLTQILLQELDTEKFRTALVLVYPSMSRAALLAEVATELGIAQTSGRPSVHGLLAQIQQEIMRLHQEGKRVVMIIDESHFLSTEALHILRTLSNIEVPKRKLISVLLFGEESFRKRLESRRAHRALLSRMYVRCTLRPLEVHEVEQYIKFRLLMVGCNEELFAPSSFAPIHAATGGIPREVNRLANSLLLAIARKGLPWVEPDTVQRIVERDREAMRIM